MQPYRAVLVGATGAVGSALVAELLASEACVEVRVLARRPLAHEHSKLIQRTFDLGADLEKLEAETAQAAQGCEVAFCTLGVGQPRKQSREAVWRVDVDCVAAFARGARAAGVSRLCLLSSVQPESASRSWYMRLKQGAEAAVLAAGLPHAAFFRPSLLVTEEIRYGLQDRLTQALFPLIQWALPSRFHGIRVEDLARAMRLYAEAGDEAPVSILQYADFAELLKS
jgi:uncharacterized protein YbjT (DUF2867 family)